MLHTALISAAVFAGPAAGGAKARTEALSPVAIDATPPFLEIRAIVRRSDI